MRVGVVVAGGVDRSGEGRVVPELLDLLEALSRWHQVHVVALRQEPRPGAWRVAGVDVWNVGTRPRRLRALFHLWREHRRCPFDVLVGYALVPQGALAVAAGTMLGIPCVVSAPGGEFAALGAIGFGGWRNRRGRFWVRLACRGASAVLVPSSPVRRLAGERGLAVRRVPLPLAEDVWPREAVAAPAAPARVAWIGSVNRVKDPELMVETVRYLRDRGAHIAVDVVGEDFLGGAVGRLVREAGLDPWITLHGYLPREGVRAVLRRAALLLVTSRFEAGPRVVLEAASLGVPAVGTRVGYLDEWSPEAASAVDRATPESLGNAVRALLDDEEGRRTLGRAARARLAEHDASSVAAVWDSIFREVREGGARG